MHTVEVCFKPQLVIFTLICVCVLEDRNTQASDVIVRHLITDKETILITCLSDVIVRHLITDKGTILITCLILFGDIKRDYEKGTPVMTPYDP